MGFCFFQKFDSDSFFHFTGNHHELNHRIGFCWRCSISSCYEKKYNPFTSLLEIESFSKEPLQHFNSKEPQQSEKVNSELTSKQSASDIFITLLDILQTSSGTFALVRVKDQEFWVQQGEWLEDFEVFEIKEDKLVLKQVSMGSGNAQKKMEIGFQ